MALGATLTDPETMEIPADVLKQFHATQVKNPNLTAALVAQTFNSDTIPLNEIVLYHRGVDLQKNVVATALRIHAKEASDATFGGILRVEILGGFGFEKRGVSYFVTERCNNLRKLLTTNTSTFKKCTFVPIGGLLFRLGEIEHMCHVPSLSYDVSHGNEKAFRKRKKYEDAKDPPIRTSRHLSHLKRTLRGIVIPYYKHDRLSFEATVRSDVETCLVQLFYELDVNVSDVSDVSGVSRVSEAPRVPTKVPDNKSSMQFQIDLEGLGGMEGFM